jgi:hypothetical protein
MKSLQRVRFTLLLLVALLVFQPAFTASAAGNFVITRQEGVANSCSAGSYSFYFGWQIISSTTIRVTWILGPSQSYSATGPFSGGNGSVMGGLHIDALPANTIVGVTITDVISGEVVGIAVNCTTGQILGSNTPGVGPQFFEPGDDRLNREPGVPAALYCRNNGDVHIYRVDAETSRGSLGIIVTKGEIDAVISRNPTVNTLIKQSADGALRVYYLPASKELQFNAVDLRPPYKPYTFIWRTCA